jgi:biopolymer transport protein ExbD
MNSAINPLLLATLFVTVFWANQLLADEYAGKQWPASQQVSIDKINHEPYNALLQKYVDTDGLVNYKAWQKNQFDREALKSYLESLSRANPNLKADKKAKLAYWINAYNALTIEGILRVYPTTSIRNHTAKLFGYNIWKNLYLYSGDSKITLDSIEHKVLRTMNEPRIHFAIVCASIGCPRLLNQAYTAEKLEDQLVTNSTDFFSRSQNLQIDNKNATLKLSSIMSWFGSDFGESTSEQIKKVAKYFPEDAKSLIRKGGYSVGYLSYDWDLNSQK